MIIAIICMLIVAAIVIKVSIKAAESFLESEKNNDDFKAWLYESHRRS